MGQSLVLTGMSTNAASVRPTVVVDTSAKL